MAGLRLFIAVFVAALAVGGKSVEAQVHHVVGSDPSDIGTWSTGRVFKVGDHIWFNYSAEHDSMVELKSMEEYLSCDVSNPIKMYTDKVSLEEEGIRYFASGNLESCKNGLKLHVVVHPQPKAPPPTSSAPTYLSGLPYMLGGLLLCLVGL
ncbi:hypothetical protein LguiB_005233 [Lonicera macranthoides]